MDLNFIVKHRVNIVLIKTRGMWAEDCVENQWRLVTVVSGDPCERNRCQSQGGGRMRDDKSGIDSQIYELSS